ncbi:exported hypothetical protein [Candidatus Sulfopaludibacter sp. SbA3]|nr:exported hypothetical protein [Candidatus Sulfopaludibacter sp. SbA3]
MQYRGIWTRYVALLALGLFLVTGLIAQTETGQITGTTKRKLVKSLEPFRTRPVR